MGTMRKVILPFLFIGAVLIFASGAFAASTSDRIFDTTDVADDVQKLAAYVWQIETTWDYRIPVADVNYICVAAQQALDKDILATPDSINDVKNFSQCDLGSYETFSGVDCAKIAVRLQDYDTVSKRTRDLCLTYADDYLQQAINEINPVAK